MEIVGTTMSGNCSFGIVLNFVSPYIVTRIAMIYIAVLLSMLQLVGLNCLIFFMAFSKTFIEKVFIVIPARPVRRGLVFDSSSLLGCVLYSSYYSCHSVPIAIGMAKGYSALLQLF